MWDLGRDRILASAAVALLLTAPVCALAQEQAAMPTGEHVHSLSATAGVTPAAPSLRASVIDEARAPKPAADPMAALDPADRAIAEKIRDLLAAKPNRFFADKKEHAAVEAFYQKRNLAPLWLDKGVENARAKAVIARIKNADADGLDPARLQAAELCGAGAGRAGGGRTDAHADRAHLCAACAGRPLPRTAWCERTISSCRSARPIRRRCWPPSPTRPMPARRSINSARRTSTISKLKAALAQLRGKTGGARDEIAGGSGAQVQQQEADGRCARAAVARAARRPRRGDRPALRRQARRGREGIPARQRAAGDRQSRRADDQEAQSRRTTAGSTPSSPTWNAGAGIRATSATSHVEVNLPDFTLKVMHDGRQVWTTRIVIGKPSMPTPLLARR